MNTWSHRQYQWDTEEEEETDNNAVSYRTNAMRIVLDKEQATTKVMAMQIKTMVLSKTVKPMYSLLDYLILLLLFIPLDA